ncbi:MAG: class IV adenylate cyclase [Candidatus Pacebacteria bacterium]|nr:class IV adenylate cyclase [Candidatus Paceibacterota bacterium]
MYEVEVKSKLNNREEVKAKLESLGCKFGEELHQVDYIFIPKDVVFPPPYEVPVLRVRKQNSKSIFTMKISKTSRQDVIEKEFEISDGDRMIEVLGLIGYKQVPMVDKKRIKTNYQDMEIVLDIVKDLGEFIEAEKIVTHEDPKERIKIQTELLDFLEQIGVPREDQVINGKYDIMLFEKYGIN